jgi:hypothetical protein
VSKFEINPFQIKSYTVVSHKEGGGLVELGRQGN